jgi:hypothetical protein
MAPRQQSGPRLTNGNYGLQMDPALAAYL